MIFVALLGSSALAGQNAVSAKKPESTKQAAPSAKLQIDPKAVDILKASSEKLAGAKP